MLAEAPPASALRRLLRGYRAVYADLPRPLWKLSGITLVTRAGTMVLPFLALYLTEHEGLSVVAAGRVVALYGVGSMAAALLGGWATHRLGTWRVLVSSFLGGGAVMLCVPLVHGVVALGLAIVLLSLVADTHRAALFTAAAGLAPPQARARGFAQLRAAINLGMSIGPALGGVLAAIAYPLLFVVDALTCWLAALGLVLGFRPEALPGPGARATGGGAVPSSPLADRPFVLFLGLVVLQGAIFAQIFSTLPLYLRDGYGLGERAIGAVLAVNAATIVLVELPLLRVLERFGQLHVVAVGVVFLGGGFALLPFGRGALYAVGTVLVWTVGEMLTLPVASAVVAHRAAEATRGKAMGYYTFAFSTSWVLGPLGGTFAYQRFGERMLWLGCGALGLLVAAGFAALARPLAEPLSERPAA